jgi:hypothetical protein
MQVRDEVKNISSRNKIFLFIKAAYNPKPDENRI